MPTTTRNVDAAGIAEVARLAARIAARWPEYDWTIDQVLDATETSLGAPMSGPARAVAADHLIAAGIPANYAPALF